MAGRRLGKGKVEVPGKVLEAKSVLMGAASQETGGDTDLVVLLLSDATGFNQSRAGT
jgi:hypothetical protein